MTIRYTLFIFIIIISSFLYTQNQTLILKNNNTKNDDSKSTKEKSSEQIIVAITTPTDKNVATSTKTEITIKKTPTKTITTNTTSTTPTIQTTIITPELPPDFAKINEEARLAIINIFCTTKSNELSPISATGIVINPNGLILTNAHVAEYFLIRDFREKDFVECIIRTGSPAYPRYNVELVYISPTWVINNKTVLKEQSPKGTGENDYAFLRITNTLNNEEIKKLDSIPLNIREEIIIGEPVVLVSYPAGFLGGLSIIQNLNVASAITLVQDVFTFINNTIDIISVGGTVLSQKGASGGAVVDKYGTTIGLISVSSSAVNTSDRQLLAITPAYINRSLQNDINMTLSQFLSQDIGTFTKKFQTETAPLLTKILIDELNKNQ